MRLLGWPSHGYLATTQVFPGAAVAYGSAFNSFKLISNAVSPVASTTDTDTNTNTDTQSEAEKTYFVPAYADAEGTQPCEIEVREFSAPPHCRVIGDNQQNKQYTPGDDLFIFEFAYSCSDQPGSDPGGGTPGDGEIRPGDPDPDDPGSGDPDPGDPGSGDPDPDDSDSDNPGTDPDPDNPGTTIPPGIISPPGTIPSKPRPKTPPASFKLVSSWAGSS